VPSAAAFARPTPRLPLATYRGQVPGPPFFVAQATGHSVGIYKAPGASATTLTLPSPNEDGAPRVFLLVGQQGDWLQVLLPIRPNGSVGWIRAADVAVSQHQYRMQVELGAHRVTVWKGSTVIDQERIGVGAAQAPTPGGNYYVTEVLEAPNPAGSYGPYALGLSGYSDVYKSFAGADGAVGIHGTNDPSSIGRNVSHGCIRMSNAGVTMLAHTLPLGTPVVIVA